jgi:MFS family permease
MAQETVLPADLRRLVALAGAVVFLDTLFYTAITPLLPGYVREFGLSHAQAGLLTASYAVGTLIAALPAAWLGARMGVRPTLLTGLGLFAAASLAFGLATSAPVLVSARFVQGVAGACSWGAALAWIGGRAPPSRRGGALGLALAAGMAGTIFGPALGSVAAAADPGLVFGVIAALAAALGAITLTQHAPPGEPVGVETLVVMAGSGRAWAGAWLLAAFGLFGGALALLGPLALSAAGATATAIGAVFLLGACGELAAQLLAGRAADRHGRLAPVRWVMPAAALGVLGLAAVHSAAALGVLLVVTFPAAGVLMAPGSAVLADVADARGLPQLVVAGLGNMAWSVGEVAGAAGAGLAGSRTPACLALTVVALATWAGALAASSR